MDTNHLRSLTLSKLLSSSYGNGLNSNSNNGVETVLENNKPLKINKQNVQNLVEGFWKLNQNEKLLFLIGIQQQQGGGNQNKDVVVGSTTPPINPVNGDPTTATPTNLPTPIPPTTPPIPPPPTPTPSLSRLSSTTSWLLTNFTSDPLTALPKEEVYDFYTQTFPWKPISTADFGKLMRQVFPEVKARRLGQRGASKYCYANIRKKSPNDVDKPTLTEIKISLHDDYLNWAKANFSMEFDNLETLLYYLKCNNFKNPRKRRNSSVSMVTKKFGNQKAEDLEISKYFKNDDDDWPHLRNLLDNSKKRHCSNNVVMTTKIVETFEHNNRSASVPIFEQSSSSRYILSSSRSADSGYDSVHSNTPLTTVATDFNRDEFLGGNPLLSSVLMEGNTSGGGGASGDSGDEGGVLFDSVFDLIVDERGELLEMDERDELISGGGSSGGQVGGNGVGSSGGLMRGL